MAFDWVCVFSGFADVIHSCLEHIGFSVVISLIEDALETVSLQRVVVFFDFLEKHIPTWTQVCLHHDHDFTLWQPPFNANGKTRMLRVSNGGPKGFPISVTRTSFDSPSLAFPRYSTHRAHFDVFGKVCAHQNVEFAHDMISVFDLADKSGVNLKSATNSANVTEFDTDDTELPSDNTLTLLPAMCECEFNYCNHSARDATEPQTVDKEFYRQFWTLQAFFSNPQLCSKATDWLKFQQVAPLNPLLFQRLLVHNHAFECLWSICK